MKKVPLVAIVLMAISGCGGAMKTVKPETDTAQSGAVAAAFTFTESRDQVYSHLSLKIIRSGRVLYDKPVTCTGCLPASGSPVSVLDIESTGEPDVILSLFSGGANCCGVDQVFSFAPHTMTYIESELVSPGAKIEDLGHNGHLEFVSANGAFRYTFTDGAGSGEPIQIFSFRDRRFVDVTRSYPKLIAANAALWLSAFKNTSRDHYQDSVGWIAAWAADEDLLGHSKLVSRFLAEQQKAGHLNGGSGWSGGKEFIANLERFLGQQGYAPPTTTITFVTAHEPAHVGGVVH
jgi:hypothetical protein